MGTPQSTPENAKSIGGVLNGIMTARNLSQRRIAILLGVSDSQVSRWRTDRGGIRLENIERIADVFGLDEQWLRQLAGLPSNAVATTLEAIDPAMAALLDADRKETHDELGGVEPRFWPTILEAGRVARQAAIRIAQMASAGDVINTRSGRDISNVERNSSKNRRRPIRGSGADLTSSFPIAEPTQHFANARALVGAPA